MGFFETPSLLHARGGQHQSGPNMSPLHVYLTFPASNSRSYPIHDVYQSEYLGLTLDPKFTWHLATAEATRHAAQGQALQRGPGSFLLALI